MRLLVDEIDRHPESPEWLRVARDDWQLLATAEFGFGIVPDLDGILTDGERRQLVLNLAGRAVERIRSWGDPIPASTLNAVGAGQGPTGFPRDLPADMFVGPALSFVALLEPAD
ncbi:MAG: hypothetical protein GY946_30510 [bacterium]|nr:hypothetical protein [bacterium]